MIEQILSPELIQALGWTLVHTLWQAALFAILLGLALVLLRKYSARTRYVVAIGVLGAFFATTVMTFAQLYQSPVADNLTTVSPRHQMTDETTTRQLDNWTTAAGQDNSTTAAGHDNLTTAAGHDNPVTAAGPSFWSRTTTYYNDHLPLIVTLWLMGVLILQLRFIGQLAFLQRLKNYGTERFPARLAPMLQELEGKLGITKPVRYLTSFRVGSPFTAGWLRPAVLFPRGLLGELDEAQLRTIIAHELAHIKRYDFLVNLIQTLLCILFFYHPAAWWISARIDEEREHCCDDLAIEATGEAVGYAKTLLALKETELAQTSLAMGVLGKGDGFKERITRLLSGYLGTGTYGEGFTTAVIIFCFMGLAVTLSGQQADLGADAGYGPEHLRGAMDRVAAVGGPPPPPPPPPPVAPNGKNTQSGIRDFQLPDSTQTMLEEVFAQNFEEHVEEMVERGVAGPQTKFDLFLNAIWEGDLKLVKYFLENEDFDLNQEEDEGFSPLMAAASEDHPEIASMLLAAGADVNYFNRHGWTALIEAADEGSYATALVLLEAGADPNLKGKNNNRSALSMAGSEGHTEFFALLIQYGADVFSVGETHPLHEAAEEGQLTAVRQLLALKADPNVTDGEGRTPLSYAAEEGQLEVVEILLKNKADFSLSDLEGRTPLFYAVREEVQPVIRELLAAGADVNAKDRHGNTVADFAIREGNVRIVRLLNERGAAITAQTEDGGSPLAVPAREGELELVRYLLEQGVDPNQAEDCPPLFLAAREGEAETVALLARYGAKLERGCDYRDTDYFGRNYEGGQTLADYTGASPLVMALTEREEEVVGALVRLGADVDVLCAKYRYALSGNPNWEQRHRLSTAELSASHRLIYETQSWTPLLEAVESGRPKLVRLLLKAGADASRATPEGMTALSLAEELGFNEIAALLR